MKIEEHSTNCTLCWWLLLLRLGRGYVTPLLPPLKLRCLLLLLWLLCMLREWAGP